MKLVVPAAVTDDTLESSVVMEGMADAWSSLIDYGSEPALVAVGGFPYEPASDWYRNISTGANLNQSPATSPLYWEAYTNPMWDAAVTYGAGAEVLHWVGPTDYREAHWWRSKAGSNLNHEPPDDPTTADTYWTFVDTGYQRWVPGKSTTATWLRNYDGFLYEALATTTGTTAPPDDVVNWLLYGATNRFAAFDAKTQSQTTSAKDIEYTIAIAGRIDTIGLLELDASSVNITMMDGATEVHNDDYSLISDDLITDWYAYFFADIEYDRELIVSGLPNTLDPDVIITITNSGTRKVGHITLGTGFDIGETTTGSIGIDDFSRIEIDEFGNREVIERGYSRRGEYNVMIEKARQSAVYRMIAAQRASAALFIPSEAYGSTFIFGYPKNWAISIDHPNHSMLNISIEGL